MSSLLVWLGNSHRLHIFGCEFYMICAVLVLLPRLFTVVVYGSAFNNETNRKPFLNGQTDRIMYGDVTRRLCRRESPVIDRAL